MRIFARIAIALLSALLTVVALDRAVAFLDLAYTPTRGRKNEVRRIERAEFAVQVRLNALGFRERRLPSPKPPGALRGVALGASGAGCRSPRAAAWRRPRRGPASSRPCSPRATRAATRW